MTAEQRTSVEALLDANGSISAEALEEIIDADGAGNGRTKGSGRNTFLVREDPLTLYGTPKTERQKDMEAALGLASHGGPAGGNGPALEEPTPPTSPMTQEDILRFSGRLMATMTSPEEKLLIDLEPPAGQQSVDEGVRSLSFAPSPADVPDFL